MPEQHIKRTALYDKHIAHGARMVPFAGFEMPLKYTSESEEHIQVRQCLRTF